MAMYVSILVISFSVCFIISFIFKRLNLVDVPDGIRKTHKEEVTLGGGLALYSIGLLCYLLYTEFFIDSRELSIVYLISSIVLLLGFIDDIKPLPISFRLIVQILASWLVIILTDLYLRDLGDLFGLGNIYLGKLGIPITIFMVVGICNAFNMLDGMDGLITLVSIVAFSGIGILAFLNNEHGFLFMTSVSLFGFLFFNLGLIGKKWKMFLGDGGSMWIGFILAWFLVALSQQEKQLFSPVIALWIVLLPLIDALSTFLGRLWTRKQIFSADRTHIHHILLDTGLDEWKILLIFFLISFSSTAFGIFSFLSDVNEYFLFYGFLTLWLFYFLVVKYPYSNNSP